jgi:rubrerythrin
MATLNGSKTHQNLKTAFANEAQANRRYLYFARQADVEGYPEIAGLFRDTAEGEAGHAHGHMDHLRAVGDPVTGKPIGATPVNLEAAIAGETLEYTGLYPEMAATAREEGFPEIADWFERLAKAEHNHAERFRRGLESVVLPRK